MQADSFPLDRPEWDRKTVEEWMWTAWKATFKSLQEVMVRKLAVPSDRPTMFWTAASAQQVHGINLTQGGDIDPRGTRSGIDVATQLDEALEILTVAATNSNTALDLLVTATTDQYADISAKLETLTTLGNNPTPVVASRSRTPLPVTEKRLLDKRILVLQAAVKNKSVKSGF